MSADASEPSPPIATPPQRRTNAELTAELAATKAELANVGPLLTDVLAQIAELKADRSARDEAIERAKDRAADKATREANASPRRMIGTVQVYDDDSDAAVIERANDLRAGNIPADKATRFRVDGHIYPWGSPSDSRGLHPLAKAFGDKLRAEKRQTIPLGTILHRDEIPPEDRPVWAARGVIVPVG